MLKKSLLIIALTFILFSLTTILKIDKSKKITNKYANNFFQSFYKKNDNSIGYIEINQINLKEKLYKINSTDNNVDKNITILKESILPPNKNDIIYIAAHSGTGPTAYFKNLNYLKKNDEIIIYLYNNKYTYIVKKIWNETKTGYIHITKDDNTSLILTTCNPHNEKLQLVLSCTKKES